MLPPSAPARHTAFASTRARAFGDRLSLAPISSLLGMLILFVIALVLTRSFEPRIVSAASGHETLGIGIFFATTALAVVFPFFTNLPFVPVAVLLWGPWWTAFIMFCGWMAGSAASFMVARFLSGELARRFPGVSRYADIDRLIAPSAPIASLVLLRMTFPVDILSYALGLFSTRTTARQNLLSTAIGVAPFALLFAFLPTFPVAGQTAFLAGSAFVFLGYASWVTAGVPRHPVPVERSAS